MESQILYGLDPLWISELDTLWIRYSSMESQISELDTLWISELYGKSDTLWISEFRIFSRYSELENHFVFFNFLFR